MQRRSWVAIVLFVLCSPMLMWSQAEGLPAASGMKDLLAVRPTNRVLEPLNKEQRAVLAGQRHPWARPEYWIGKVRPGLEMRRMVLVLSPDAAQDAALEELVRAQSDPESSYYHRWLTPAEFGERFGVSKNDVARVVGWLEGSGLQVEEVTPSRRTIVFSGTAAQVESTFRTTIAKYRVQGAVHYANSNDPEIPRALAAVVRGVVALHDFRSAPMHVIAPAYTSANGAHFLMPQDWATIYDVNPLYAQGLDGTGQSIAVLGRVDVALSDVRTFRVNAGLPANDPQMIVNGADPGFPWCDDELESAMDVEWAGAIADNATVKFVTSKSTTTDGISLSAQYAVNQNVASVVSLSYGLCEAALGTAGNAFWRSTWQQAAAQGMTVFVSAGDGGAAGCDPPSQTTAAQGRAVNGLCSSSYSTCVGGTQFNDASNPGLYWSQTNGAGQSSALGYIPESAWNESGWSGGLWAGGGGASAVYSKPAWQVAPGVPADGMRDVPDVSMHASIEDAYVVQVQGSTFYASGTSAAAPSLASVMALVNENAGGAQGNANPVLYALANGQLSANGAAVFHDVTSGNNSVPGLTGFNASAGFDEATGLGSVDASVLVNHWKDANNTSFTLASNVTAVTVAPGGSGTATISLAAQGGFSSAATLAASGAAAGVTVKFSAASVTAGTPVTVTISAAANAAASSSMVTIRGTGGGLTETAQIAVTVTAPNFTLATSAAATVTAGSPTKITISTAAVSGFKAPIALSVTGQPNGVTAMLAPASIASPGNGTSTLTLNATTSAVGGAATLTVKGVGGGLTRTQTISLTVVVPSFTLTANAANATVTAGSTASVVMSTSVVNGFKSAISLAVNGLPKGVTVKFAPASVASPGSGSSTLTLTAATTTLGGAYTPTVTASGGGVTKTQAVSLSVIGPSFALTLAGATVNLARGGSIPIAATTAVNNGFAAGIVFSVSGLPKGVTGTFAPATVASPGNGTGMLTLKAAANATVGTVTVTVTASGGGMTKAQTLSLVVK